MFSLDSTTSFSRYILQLSIIVSMSWTVKSLTWFYYLTRPPGTSSEQYIFTCRCPHLHVPRTTFEVPFPPNFRHYPVQNVTYVYFIFYLNTSLSREIVTSLSPCMIQIVCLVKYTIIVRDTKTLCNL